MAGDPFRTFRVYVLKGLRAHFSRQHWEESSMKKKTIGPFELGVSKNNGTPKSSILIGFSIIFTIHFGGQYHPYFWFNTQLIACEFTSLEIHTEPQVFVFMDGVFWGGGEKGGACQSALSTLFLFWGLFFSNPRDPITLSEDDWGVQSPPKRKVFRFHYHSQKVSQDP